MKATPRLCLLALLAAVALTTCARAVPTGSGGGPRAAGPSPSASSTLGPTAGVCPKEMPLDPGPDARTSALAAAEAAVPQRYAKPIDTTGFQIVRAYPADLSTGYGPVAYGLCGNEVGHRTWIVELSFPKMLPSIDLSAGQLFLSRFPERWKVWFRYH